MLKRCQVLLEDWQVEHLKLRAGGRDLSFSEMVRVLLCEGISYSLPVAYPDCKSKSIDRNELDKLIAEGVNVKTSEARRHQIISKLYFESRKATECFSACEKRVLEKL
jgi:hypothetical protein